MEPRPKVCAVTGAGGYVGSHVASAFSTRNWSVLELGRPGRPTKPGRGHLPYDLDHPVDPAIFTDNRVRVLVHCAYDFRPNKWADVRRINVEGSARLLRAAKQAGVEKIVLISSISAFAGCRSLYGKAKLEIEDVAASLGALIVRSGLVYSDQPYGGMFGSLWRTIGKSSVVPLIGSGAYLQYLVHADDLCELVLRFSGEDVPWTGKPVVAASPRGWSMRALLSAMADAQHVRVKFVPIPWRPIWLGLKTLELLGQPVPFRSDSVISLVWQDPSPDFTFAKEHDLMFRDFDAQRLRDSAADSVLQQSVR